MSVCKNKIHAFEREHLGINRDPNAITEKFKGVHKPLLFAIKKSFSKIKPALLGMLTLRQLVEVGSKHLKSLPAYIARVDEMLSQRNQMMEKANVLAEGLQAFSLKNKVMANRLYNMMHDSTISGADPSIEGGIEPIEVEFWNVFENKYTTVPANRANLALFRKRYLNLVGKGKRLIENINSVESFLRSPVRSEKQMQYINTEAKLLASRKKELDAMKEAVLTSEKRAEAYTGLKSRWDRLKDNTPFDAKNKHHQALMKAWKEAALPESEFNIPRAYYVAMRDMYRDRSNDMEAAIIERIKLSEGDESQRSTAIMALRAEFESSRLLGPYFPLARQGAYFISALKRKAKVSDTVHRPRTKVAKHEVTQENTTFKSSEEAFHHKKLKDLGGLDKVDVKQIDDNAWVYVNKDTGEQIFKGVRNVRHEWKEDKAVWEDEEKALSARGRDDLLGKNLIAVEQEGGWVLKENPMEFSFTMRDSEYEMEETKKEMREEGYEITDSGMKSQIKASSLEGVSSKFLTDVMATLGDDSALKDQVYQLYLEALPELSQRKSHIHRKKTDGFDTNALRSFSKTMFHMSHQIAKMRGAPVLDITINHIEEQAKRVDEKHRVKADQLVDELKRRHEWVMNPSNASWTNTTSAFGFAMYLGLSPAAALVNLTQVPIMTFPSLAAKYGVVPAYKALMGAMKEISIKTATFDQREAMDIDSLSAEEKEAFRQWQDMGVYDNTQAHNLAGIGDSDSIMNSPGFNKAMGTVGHMFHKAEVVNRQVTLLAAYRLARQGSSRKSKSNHHEAVKFASDTTWDTQFDYGNANRARFMQSDSAKVFLMFKSYSQHMIYFMWRTLMSGYEGVGGAIKTGKLSEVKKALSKSDKEARREFNGVMGMTFLFAGTKGLPLFSIFGIANLLHWDDDDEPWDAESEFKSFLNENLGETAGGIINRGFANQLGLDVSSRVSLEGLLWRDTGRDSEGRDAYHAMLEGAAGPLVGLIGKTYNAGKLFSDDHEFRAVETVMPKALRDVMKAARFANEGALNTRGVEVVAREDLNIAHLIYQASGFSPDKLSAQYDKNNRIKNYENFVKKRKQRLLAAYAMARSNKDKEEMKILRGAMKEFSIKNPHTAINDKTLMRSMKARDRIKRESDGGLWMRNSTQVAADRLGV